jgi:hypothetical protein
LITLCVIERPEGKTSPTRHNIQLEPGANPISRKLWGLAQEQNTVKALIEQGTLSDMGPTADGAIASLTEAQAIAIVTDTFSLKLLRAWGLDEKRPKVSAAIKKRLDDHEAATKVEEKKS